jgi:hypothetical protein
MACSGPQFVPGIFPSHVVFDGDWDGSGFHGGVRVSGGRLGPVMQPEKNSAETRTIISVIVVRQATAIKASVRAKRVGSQVGSMESFG